MLKWMLLVGGLLLWSSLVFAGTLAGETPTYGRDQGADRVLYYKSGGNGDGQVEYVCESQPGKLTSASTWRIYKLVYDASNRVSTINWANGSDDSRFVCDSYTTYDYTP